MLSGGLVGGSVPGGRVVREVEGRLSGAGDSPMHRLFDRRGCEWVYGQVERSGAPPPCQPREDEFATAGKHGSKDRSENL